MFPPSQGPYTWWTNGRPIEKRDGSPRSHSAIGRVKVPACTGCNGVLAERFETPAKPLMRELFETDGEVVLRAADALVVGLWFLKTWLLLAHPAARDSEPGIAHPRWDSVRDDLWGWMVNDRPPPAGLSVWVTRRGDEVPDRASMRHIPLPTVVADGIEVEFVCLRAGVRFLDVSLVFHPGWEIEHPLEAAGRALRLWPRHPREPADFTVLQEVGSTDVAWLKGPRLHFFPGMFPNPDLPPISSDLNLMTELPHRFLQMAAW